MTEKEILMSLLAKTLNKTDGEIAEILYKKDGENTTINEDAINILIDADAARIARIKEGQKPSKDLLENQYKRGIKEAMVNFEKEFIDKTGYESDKKGIELVMSYSDTLKNAKTKLSDDEFKLDRRYIDAEKAWTERLKETEQRLTAERDEIVTGYQKKEKFGRIKNDVKTLLESMNPILPENPVVKNNQINTFLKVFENGYDYELQDDANHIIVDGGKRLEDAHGNPVTFKQFAENKIGEYFEFSKQTQRNSSSNKNVDNAVKITNNEEYLKAANAAKTPEELKAVYEQFHGADHSAEYNK